MLRNNETTRVNVPVPFLINNPNIEVLESMTNRRIPINDIIGKKFNRWTVLYEAAPYVSKMGKRLRKFHCVCECGTKRDIFLNYLGDGRSKSCGCFKVERIKQVHTKHGKSKNGSCRLYTVWANMKGRCYNKNDKQFHDYGGRGIRVCQEWLDFIAFYRWATENGYSDGKLIDRKVVDGNYDPSNVRFVSVGLSARNKRLLSRVNISGYRGVDFIKRIKKNQARIAHNGERIYLGVFTDPIRAARAYDAKAKELDAGHPLNFP